MGNPISEFIEERKQRIEANCNNKSLKAAAIAFNDAQTVISILIIFPRWDARLFNILRILLRCRKLFEK